MLVCDRCDCLIFGHTQALANLSSSHGATAGGRCRQDAAGGPGGAGETGDQEEADRDEGDEEDPAEDPIGGSPGGVGSVSAAVEQQQRESAEADRIHSRLCKDMKVKEHPAGSCRMDQQCYACWDYWCIPGM